MIAERADGARLLERRPPLGIWGGLWGFPEIESRDDVDTWCLKQGLRRTGEVVALPSIKHTFTHFELTIWPFVVPVDDGTRLMDSPDWLWYNGSEPAQVGLAKPVATLLRQA